MRKLRLISTFAWPLAFAAPAVAHTSERGQIMLLPTGLYMLGGALTVAASVLLVAMLPALSPRRALGMAFELFRLTPLRRALPSLLVLAAIVILAAAGIWGPFDPIANPLPAAVWSLWWTALSAASIIFGNLWAVLNPWWGLHGLAGVKPRFHLPAALGQWPAVALFFGFTWFELIDPAPSDPGRLAVLVITYLVFNFAGMFLVGDAWLKSVDCFSVYFRLIGKLSPVQWAERDGRLNLTIVMPGAALLEAESTASGMAAFVLLALSSVSFDGLMRTFFWAGKIGVNPLEFPGRSAVMLANTLGLAGMFLALSAAFTLATFFGRVRAGGVPMPRLIFAIMPIACAYHLAHYLPGLPVSLMQLAKSLSDPFGMGANLFGTAGLEPPSSIMMDHHNAALVYRAQVMVIVLGHVMAVAVADVMALRSHATARLAIISQIPLNILMVLYTIFGLWLLSTPVIG